MNSRKKSIKIYLCYSLLSIKNIRNGVQFISYIEKGLHVLQTIHIMIARFDKLSSIHDL